MQKMDGKTAAIVDENVSKLKELFPEALTEGKIDFEMLQQLLGKNIETKNERYSFVWKGKSDSIKIVLKQNSGTLRPDRESSVDWEKTKNLFIEGDNLEVLRLLQAPYRNKIAAIYLDPPYNTGKDLIYKNDYSEDITNYLKFTGQADEEGKKLNTNTESSGRYHSDWLSMMYSRIRLAKNLLSDEGIMCVTIDDYEMPRLWLLMNEIFGEENHLGTIVIRNNPAGRSTTKGVSITHEYALLFGKTTAAVVGRLKRNEDQINRYDEEDAKGKFEWVNFRKPGSLRSESPKMYYPIFANERTFRVPKMAWVDENKEWILEEECLPTEEVIYPIDDSGKERRWRWAIDRFKEESGELKTKKVRGELHIYMKGRLNEEGVLPMTWWGDKKYSSTAYGTNLVKQIFSELQIFSYPKSLYAVKDCISAMTPKKDAIVLDLFAGSATTAHAVMELNLEDGGSRRFIMIQLPEQTEDDSEAKKLGFDNICKIGEERIRRVGKKMAEDNNSVELDTGFKVFKLDTTNLSIWDEKTEDLERTLLDNVDAIKDGRFEEDVLYEVLIKYGIDLTVPITEEDLDGKKLYLIAGGYLTICLEDNLDLPFIEKLAKRKPERVVFRDTGFKDDTVKTNAEMTLKKHGVEDIKVL